MCEPRTSSGNAAPLSGADALDAVLLPTSPDTCPEDQDRVPVSVAPELSRWTVIKHASHVAGATYLARVLAAARGFINARWLGPELYGFWGSLAFILSFGYHLHGGVQEIMAKEVPILRRHGRWQDAERLTQQSFTFFVAMLAAVSLGIAAFAFSRAGAPAYVRWGWLAAAVVLPLEVLFFFEQVVARSHERFAAISKAMLLVNGLGLALTAWLVISYGFTGLLAAAVATPAVGVLYFRYRPLYRWRLAWSWAAIRPMLRAGWPVVAMLLVFDSLTWIDRVLILGFLDATQFGYYALSGVLLQFCALFPYVVASVIEPTLYAAYGRGGRVEGIRDHVWFPLWMLAGLMPLGLGVIDLVLPWAVQRWLPAYVPGVPAMRIVLWSSVFMALAMSTKPCIVALGRQRQVLWLYVAAIVVNLVLGVWLLRQGFGLIGVAWSTTAAYACCASGLVLTIFHLLGWGWGESVRRLLALLIPLAAVLVSVLWLPSLSAPGVPVTSPSLMLTRAGGLLASAAAIGLYAWLAYRPRGPVAAWPAAAGGAE